MTRRLSLEAPAKVKKKSKRQAFIDKDTVRGSLAKMDIKELMDCRNSRYHPWGNSPAGQSKNPTETGFSWRPESVGNCCGTETQSKMSNYSLLILEGLGQKGLTMDRKITKDITSQWESKSHTKVFAFGQLSLEVLWHNDGGYLKCSWKSCGLLSDSMNGKGFRCKVHLGFNLDGCVECSGHLVMGGQWWRWWKTMCSAGVWFERRFMMCRTTVNFVNIAVNFY